MNPSLEKIDPALGVLKDFSKATHGIPAQVQKMRSETIFKEGMVPIKYKILASVLWAVSARCEPCIRFYIQEAVKQGVTEAEVGEFLALGATLGGCVGEMWSLKAFKAYQEAISGQKEGEAVCCETR